MVKSPYSVIDKSLRFFSYLQVFVTCNFPVKIWRSNSEFKWWRETNIGEITQQMLTVNPSLLLFVKTKKYLVITLITRLQQRPPQHRHVSHNTAVCEVAKSRRHLPSLHTPLLVWQGINIFTLRNELHSHVASPVLSAIPTPSTGQLLALELNNWMTCDGCALLVPVPLAALYCFVLLLKMHCRTSLGVTLQKWKPQRLLHLSHSGCWRRTVHYVNCIHGEQL